MLLDRLGQVMILKMYPLFYTLFFLNASMRMGKILLEPVCVTWRNYTVWPLCQIALKPHALPWCSALRLTAIYTNLHSMFDNAFSHSWRAHNWNAASDLAWHATGLLDIALCQPELLYCSAKTQTLKQLPGPTQVKETISSPDSSHIPGGIMREVSWLQRGRKLGG